LRKLDDWGVEVDLANLCIDESPWLTAVHHGQAEVLQLLVRNGAKINRDPKAAQRAYIFARSKGYATIMRIMVESGVVVDP
jgi:hypothetical protein